MFRGLGLAEEGGHSTPSSFAEQRKSDLNIKYDTNLGKGVKAHQHIPGPRKLRSSFGKTRN